MSFETFGINPAQFPKFQKCSGRLLIVATGRCVWDDVEKAEYDEVMCVNDMIMHFPGKVNHIYSNDHHYLNYWAQARRPTYPGGFLKHTCQVGESTQLIWPWPGHGTSSLNAVYTGLALGYDKIILAGIPLDDSGHYFDPPWVKSNFTNEVSDKDSGLHYWSNAKKQVFEGKVSSLSGRTKKLLG